MSLHILADDLSGGAETAGAVAAVDARGRVRRRVRIELDAAGTRPGADVSTDLDLDPAAEVLVVDTGSRTRDAATAARCAVQAIRAVPPHAACYLKYDSLLRGHVGTELTAVAAEVPVVFTPVVPALGRVVLDGVPRVAGVPLAETAAWALESRPAPRRLLDLFPAGAAVQVGLSEVRDPAALADRLARARPGGPVICCDAVEQHDLARIAEAAHRAGIALAGASSLAGALADRVLTGSPRPRPLPPLVAQPTVALIGSGSPRTLTQADRLAARGDPVLLVDLATLESLPLPAGDVTVVVRDRLDPAAAPRVLAAMAALARQVGPRHLVLSGGETARAVLEACDIRVLTPAVVPHLGAVVSHTDDGRVVATRPGSFGPDSGLVDLRDAVAGLVDASQEVT